MILERMKIVQSVGDYKAQVIAFLESHQNLKIDVIYLP